MTENALTEFTRSLRFVYVVVGIGELSARTFARVVPCTRVITTEFATLQLEFVLVLTTGKVHWTVEPVLETGEERTAVWPSFVSYPSESTLLP